MRKLKLQMEISIDGFVAGPRGEMDWMAAKKDKRLWNLINELTDTSDTILVGRKMAADFNRYWEGVKPDDPNYPFAQKLVRQTKVVFSKTVHDIEGQNTRVENRELVEAVNQLKGQAGKDMIVYGGASFVSSLIQHDLIDELNLIVYPVSIGEGMRIFHDKKPLKLKGSSSYSDGIILNTYVTT